jgi:PAS domain S-box-containing protein
VAALVIGAAVLVKLLLDPLTAQDTPFLLILGAIVVGAWYGGLGPGLLATGLSVLAIDYFFLDPRVSFTTFSPELLDLAAFVLEGVLVCVLTASLRAARDRAERSKLAAESSQEGLRESEARLREAEARFRTLVEHIPAMTYMEAADKHAQSNAFLYVSPQIEAVLGYSPGEWTADPLLFRKTLHPEDRERVLAEDARTNRTGESFQMEYKQVAKDGRVVWVRDESVLVRDHDGGSPYWLGVQFDITDRREAEEAMRQSEGRYRTVVKQAAEGIFIVDIETKLILEANAAYRDLLGYTAQDMLALGLTLYDVVAHDRESIDNYVRRIVENRVQFIGERRHRRKDGSLVDVEVGSSVISYGGGEALCVIVHDITERRRSAERLQRSLDALLVLYEAGQILSSSLQREEIGSRLPETARRVSSLTAVVISVPDEEGELGIWRSSGLEGLRYEARFALDSIAARDRVLREHFKTVCYGVRAASRKEEISGWCMAHFVLRARPPRPFD